MTLLQPMHLAVLTANIMMPPLVLRGVGFCHVKKGAKTRVFTYLQHQLAYPLNTITRSER